MKKRMRVTTRVDALHVRTGASMSYKVVGYLAKGSEVIAHAEQGGWYQHDKGGWSSGQYLTVIEDLEPPVTTPTVQQNPDVSSNAPLTEAEQAAPTEPDEGYDLDDEYILGMTKYTSYDASETFDELSVVQGLPFRFLDSADVRPTNSFYGRTYLDTIIADGNFLFITPGKPDFFDKFNNKSKKNLIKSFADGDEESEMAEVINDMAGRYYTFASDYTEYTSYVNAMARTAAIYMGLTDKKKYPDMDYKDRKWDLNNLSKDNKKNPIYQDMTFDNCTCFYIDGNATSFSESMSNSAEASMMTGLINKGSDMAREFRFVMGDMNALPDSEIVDASMNKVESMIGDLMSKIGGMGNGGIAQFGSMARTAIYGGNIIMPDIWKDSSYSKSYNIELKLVTPYGDKESIYLNILIPLFHLMAFSFPKQMGRAGYTAPFIVRAFAKGWFNCDFGIIESFSVKKAAQDGWSADGMPTEIDISLSIRDLYSVVGISNTKNSAYLKNTEYLDMIGTYCGVNINKPDMDRKMMMIMNDLSEKPGDFFSSLTSGIKENIQNKITNLLK